MQRRALDANSQIGYLGIAGCGFRSPPGRVGVTTGWTGVTGWVNIGNWGRQLFDLPAQSIEFNWKELSKTSKASIGRIDRVCKTQNCLLIVHLYVRGWRGMRVEVVLNRQEGVGRGFWGERHDLGSWGARCRETHGLPCSAPKLLFVSHFFKSYHRILSRHEKCSGNLGRNNDWPFQSTE